MWFLVFGLGAAVLHRLPLPAAAARLPVPPPPEARYALYFLLAALLRLVIRDARLARYERKGRRAARRREDRFRLPPPGLFEVGAGVGKGVAEAVMGNIVAAAWSGAALALRFAAARKEDPALAARRAVERRVAAARERRRAALCIVGVGAVCVAAVWLPVLRAELPRLLPASAPAWLPAVVRARLG